MCRLLKKYFVFIVGAFFCSLFLVLAFTTDRKKITVLLLKLKIPNNQTTTAFIDSTERLPRQIGQDYNIYASVLIAQAILESNSGQSGLSQAPYYNFFGIKGSYNGTLLRCVLGKMTVQEILTRLTSPSVHMEV